MQPVARDALVCASCFWAYPAAYTHIATIQIRRTDIAWQGDDVGVHDRLKAMAQKSGTTISEMLRVAARQIAKDS
jgi:hypothetical protein